MIYKLQSHILMVMLAAALSLAGCTAEDGAPGADGRDGRDVDPATVDNLQSQIDAMAEAQNVGPESCIVCHSDDGSIALSGAGHQAEYDKYKDASVFGLTINSVVSVAQGTTPETYNSTMTFTITKDGASYIDAGLSGLDQKRYYASLYDSATRKFNVAFSYGSPTSIGGGQYTVTATGAAFAPESSNAQVYAYIGDGKLDTEGMTLYGDVTNAGTTFGDANTYTSAANVTACEGCHGTPYMKHGYRAAAVAGLSDFGGCKSCHVDTTNGSHPDWQLLADNPARYAELDALAKAAAALVPPDKTKDSIRENMTAAELAKYQYNRSLMNDVHMSHNMEFPYPQEMSNCATCHEGKLGTVLTDENYSAEVCSSCHAVDNLVEKMVASPAGALFHDSFKDDLESANCSELCHKSGASYGAPVFSAIHNGYNPKIYSDDTGTRYSSTFTVSIDNASVTDNTLTIEFSAAESPDIAGLAVTDIVPTVLIGLYGYDSKHLIIGPHSRDFDDNGDGIVGQRNVDSTNLEYVVGTVHPRFTTVTAAAGSWTVTADLSAWADIIADGTVKRAEIGVMPQLKDANGVTVGLDAPSRTFDLGANAFDDAYFPDVVDVAGGCNSCHDQLATTFHSGNRGGNIKICKMCHVPSSGGSHMEMQSRSIDSYVHAVHSFQAFDPGDIDFTDPVAALEYEHHVNHTYPNFTIKNCESCHNAGTYGVPDQSKSMPGKLSAADTITTKDRNIGAVPSYVAGPASRACGSCHRADMINADDAGKLAAFNEHTKTFGYLVEDADGVWDTIVNKIMSLF